MSSVFHLTLPAWRVSADEPELLTGGPKPVQVQMLRFYDEHEQLVLRMTFTWPRGSAEAPVIVSQPRSAGETH